MATPKPLELSISVSAGMKANIGNYENADLHSSRSEKWDVSGMTQDEIDTLYSQRYEEIKAEVGKTAAARYKAVLSDGDI